MRPFRLEPVYKDYLWGGRRLITEWGKTPEKEPLAESWELAAHKDGDNVILDGELRGLRLSEAVRKYPEMVSPTFGRDETFPLMVKLIDSRLPLSVQVHPDDEYALRVEHEKGKTECWYILGHEEGAYLYLGFERETSREEFERAIRDNTLPELLHKVYVNDGDTYYIPAGTIHAIGAGVTLAEIQENSNLTYRVYDYGRVGADGKPRALHIGKALEVTRTCPVVLETPGQKGNVLVSCEKFRVERVSAPYSGRTGGEGFRFLLCVGGECVFRCGEVSFGVGKGGNVFVPSDCEEEFGLEGVGEFLVTSQ